MKNLWCLLYAINGNRTSKCRISYGVTNVRWMQSISGSWMSCSAHKRYDTLVKPAQTLHKYLTEKQSIRLDPENPKQQSSTNSLGDGSLCSSLCIVVSVTVTICSWMLVTTVHQTHHVHMNWRDEWEREPIGCALYHQHPNTFRLLQNNSAAVATHMFGNDCDTRRDGSRMRTAVHGGCYTERFGGRRGGRFSRARLWQD